MHAQGASDVGKKRQGNQDSFLIDDTLGLAIVADGMGGHAGGQIASRLATKTVQACLRAAKTSDPGHFDAYPLESSPARETLRAAIEAAGRTIHSLAHERPDLNGMGTTATAIMCLHGNAFLAHVGDSRCYLVRKGKIVQVSLDHSLVSEQLRIGTITPEQAKNSRVKNVILRSVGFEDSTAVDLTGFKMEVGDQVVLCSDGFSNHIEAAELRDLLMREPAVTAGELVALANERGGDDNITVIICRTST